MNQNGRDGQLRASHDDFNFHITNFPFPSSNIPSSPACGVFISQFVRYARACSSYDWVILRAARLSSRLFAQGYIGERLKSSLISFMVDMGISLNIMKSPSPKCYVTIWDMTIYGDPLNWSDITLICELITKLDLITDFDLISKFRRFP